MQRLSSQLRKSLKSSSYFAAKELVVGKSINHSQAYSTSPNEESKQLIKQYVDAETKQHFYIMKLYLDTVYKAAQGSELFKKSAPAPPSGFAVGDKISLLHTSSFKPIFQGTVLEIGAANTIFSVGASAIRRTLPNHVFKNKVLLNHSVENSDFSSAFFSDMRPAKKDEEEACSSKGL